MKIELTEEQAGILKALLFPKVFLGRRFTGELCPSVRYTADKLKPVYEQLEHIPMQPL